MRRTLLLACLSSFALAACAPAVPTVHTGALPPSKTATSYPQQTIHQSAPGYVSAADPRAQTAGEEILAQGGNATDAAIAVMLALTVVEPQSSGIGGGGFIVRGSANGEVSSFNGRETAPAGATPEWFLNADGTLPPFPESVKSGLSVGVPGNLAAASLAYTKYGRLPWARLFDPAIRLAREGFKVNPRLHGSLTASKDVAAQSIDARALYYNADGSPKAVGEVIVNEALAKTLETIARQGAKAFYSGENAEKLAAHIAAATPRPSPMSAADISKYKAQELLPVCSTYRTYRICGMGPPSSGGIAVLQILGMLERFDLKKLGEKNPVTWHLFLEAQRLAYADRELYVADPDFAPVPVAGLISKTYLTKRSALISPAKSLTKTEAGVPEGAIVAFADGDEAEEHGTSHFSVVDSDNAMVSYTSTIESAFGSGLMMGGYFLNNELTDFSRAPMVDGKPVANRVEGGKRPRSSMSPIVVWDAQRRPVLAIGAAGGQTIPVQTARSIIGIIDFGLDADQALALPFIMDMGDRIMVEKGSWLEGAIPRLKALGHTGEYIIREAPVKAGAVLRRGDVWQSARDPRIASQVVMP